MLALNESMASSLVVEDPNSSKMQGLRNGAARDVEVTPLHPYTTYVVVASNGLFTIRVVIIMLWPSNGKRQTCTLRIHSYN